MLVVKNDKHVLMQCTIEEADKLLSLLCECAPTDTRPMYDALTQAEVPTTHRVTIAGKPLIAGIRIQKEEQA